METACLGNVKYLRLYCIHILGGMNSSDYDGTGFRVVGMYSTQWVNSDRETVYKMRLVNLLCASQGTLPLTLAEPPCDSPRLHHDPLLNVPTLPKQLGSERDGVPFQELLVSKQPPLPLRRGTPSARASTPTADFHGFHGYLSPPPALSARSVSMETSSLGDTVQGLPGPI